jgi:hypothetical protein
MSGDRWLVRASVACCVPSDDEKWEDDASKLVIHFFLCRQVPSGVVGRLALIVLDVQHAYSSSRLVWFKRR